LALHVRSGDYLTDTSVAHLVEPCPEHYYLRALAEMRPRVGNLHTLVFSDDPAWVSAQSWFDARCSLMTNPDLDDPTPELQLMSACTHHIISNSTFSWWSAWLADSQPDHQVIAPRTWFKPGNARRGDSDIVPERWTRM